MKKASTSEGSIPAALPLMASTWAGSHSLRSTLSGTSSQSLRKSVTALRLRLYPNVMDAGTQRERELSARKEEKRRRRWGREAEGG